MLTCAPIGESTIGQMRPVSAVQLYRSNGAPVRGFSASVGAVGLAAVLLLFYAPSGAYADPPWEDNAKVSDDTGTGAQDHPSVAVDVSGNVTVVWEDYRNDVNAADIYSSYRAAGDTAWTAHARVNDPTGVNREVYPDVAVAADGTSYAVWFDQRTGSDVYMGQRPGGGNWSANERVNSSGGAGGEQGQSLAVDPSGNVYIVWTANNAAGISFRYRSNTASWGSQADVDDDPWSAGQYFPSIAADASGNAYAVWVDRRLGTYDIYSSYRPSGGAWITNTKVNDDTGGADHYSPAIAVGSSGDAVAAWEDNRNGNSDIYSSFRPAGGSWGASERVNDDSGSAYQLRPQLAVDNRGNIHAVWYDARNGNPDIYASYRPLGGMWGRNFRVNDDSGGAAQSFPGIAVDATGNAYAVWRDDRNANGDIYFSYRPVMTYTNWFPLAVKQFSGGW